MSRGYAWGIDCGSLRVGLGLVDMDTGEIHSRAAQWRKPSLKLTDISESLALCRKRLELFYYATALAFPPATVAYEMPTGRFPSPTLMMHAGLIVDYATASTLLLPWRCGVTEWKRIVQGHGQAPKDSLIPWCASLGHVTDDVDRAAGVAIAAFAARTVGGLDLGLLHGAEEAKAA